MQNYVVTLVDRETGERERIRVQADCTCGMQEFVETLTDLKIAHPVVVDIDERKARHLKLVDPDHT